MRRFFMPVGSLGVLGMFLVVRSECNLHHARCPVVVDKEYFGNNRG
jgi:hypothetical protein